jgi:hypothetical protein
MYQRCLGFTCVTAYRCTGIFCQQYLGHVCEVKAAIQCNLHSDLTWEPFRDPTKLHRVCHGTGAWEDVSAVFGLLGQAALHSDLAEYI